MKQNIYSSLRRILVAGVGFVLIALISTYMSGCGSITPSGSSGNTPTTGTTSPPVTPPSTSQEISSLSQEGLVVVGRVVQRYFSSFPPNVPSSLGEALDAVYMASHSFHSKKTFSTKDSSALVPSDKSTVILSVPPGSFPGNQLTLIVNNTQLNSGQYIKVVATPNNDVNNTFTARQINPATISDFQNQQIGYQGLVTMSVTCKDTCAEEPISFVVGNAAKYNFIMNPKTMVEGFGSPASIKVEQTVDVIVLFSGGTPNVIKVSNPSSS